MTSRHVQGTLLAISLLVAPAVLAQEMAPAGNQAPAASEAAPVTASPVEAAAPEAVTKTEEKPVETITYEDFRKVDLRVGTIKTAERVENTDKLIKFTVDIGTEERIAIAGIGAKYAPEELVGRQVIFVANLAPKKMRGIESHGMLLAASTEDDIVLLAPSRDIAPGAEVR